MIGLLVIFPKRICSIEISFDVNAAFSTTTTTTTFVLVTSSQKC
jgi:hypothetical protein